MWYHEHIGGGRCPVVDTWWQTETGAHPDHAAARHHDDASPARRRRPFPGHRRGDPERAGRDASSDGGGLLALTKPWPAMLRGIYGDPERFVQQYWTKWPDGVYFTGDGAQARRRRLLLAARPRRRRAERRGPSDRHDGSRERAGRSPEAWPKPRSSASTHEIKGQAIAAFVTLKEGIDAVAGLRRRAEGARGQEDRRASRGPTRSCLPPTCPRRDPARSCGGCCATSPKARRSATRRRWRIPNVVARLKDEYEALNSVGWGSGLRPGRS